MNNINVRERVDMIVECVVLVGRAYGLIREATEGLPERLHLETYLFENFRRLLGEGRQPDNPYGDSLEKLLDRLCSSGDYEEGSDV